MLIVDDDPGVRLLCAVSLSDRGFEVIEAEDGQQALERAVAEQPDLVLADLNMPRLNGFQLLAALRRTEQTRAVPVVFLSGEADSVGQARARKLGARALLAKPFDPVAVSEFIAEVLGRLGPANRPVSATRGIAG